jgi:hypothetical protein
MVDMSQLQQSIPPEALAAIQQRQGGMNGADVGMILQQLMEMSPEEVAQVLAQMGIQVTPEQVHSAAENWVDQAAGKQAAGGVDEEDAADSGADEAAEGEAPQAPAADLEQAEAAAGETPSDEAAEGDEGDGDGAQLPPGAQPTMQQGPAAGGAREAALAELMQSQPQSGGGAMPRGAGGPSGGPMDDLISAQMMQRAVGNPNAPVPTAARSPIPMPRANAAGTPSANPRMGAMIADLYRSTGGKGTKTRRPSNNPMRGGK